MSRHRHARGLLRGGVFDKSFTLKAGGYFAIEAMGDDGLMDVAPFQLGRNDHIALFNSAEELIELVRRQEERLVEGMS